MVYELRKCYVLVQIYGKEDEIKKMKDFLEAIKPDGNQDDARKHDNAQKWQMLIDEITKNLRQEVLIKREKEKRIV